MNRPQKTNNPGDLRYVGQAGATKDEHGFCVYPDAPSGWRGLVKQIKLDQGRNLSFRTFIGKYAPENENNTSQYLQLVCTGLGVKPEDMLSSRSAYAVAGLIALEEGYFAEG